VDYGDIHAGYMTMTMHKQGDNSYEMKTVSTTVGIASWFRSNDVFESTQWTLRNNRVVPFLYNFQDEGRDDEKNIQVRFDWNELKAINNIDGKPWIMEVPEDTQDKLSYIPLLMLDLKNGKRDVNYRIADGGKLKTYRFQSLGTETVSTGVGELPAIKVKRSRDKPKRKFTLFWCAQNYGYLPVKIEKWKKAKPAYSITLKSYETI
jgi:hypothetical protein